MRRLSPREIDSFFLKRREMTLAARSEVLNMLEVKEDRWSGWLEDETPRRSSGCGAYIPELTTHRHRGRLLCLGSRAETSTLQGRHRRFVRDSAFHTYFRGLLSLLVTQQKWYHHLHQVCVCVVFFSYLFGTSSSLDVTAGVT